MRHKTLAQFALMVYHDWHDIVEGFEYRIDGNVVSIAGTKDGKDLFTDARFLPRFEDGLGMVAGGFWDVAQDMSLKIARETSGPIILTGHSAGGALALLVGAHMASNWLPVEEIVTFGAPKVGRLKVLDNVHHCKYRHGKDLVSYLGLRGTKGPILKVGRASKWRPNLDDHAMTNYARTV